MTSEEVERINEAGWGAFNAGDLDAWLALFDPDFEGRSVLVEAEGGGVYEGIEGARAWWDNLQEAFESVEVAVDQFVSVGPHVLSLNKASWVGKESGVELTQEVFFITEIRDGRFLYVHTLLDPAAAFAEMAQRIGQGASSPSQ